MPPITVIAGSELLDRVVLSYLTADQQEVVEPVLEARQQYLQDVAYQYVSARAGQRGA
jgi:hypothetical protein